MSPLSVFPWPFSTAFAVVALALATVGIYGIISYSVTQRVHEIGIRLAVGAQPSSILRDVLGRGGKMALLGIAAGLAVSLGPDILNEIVAVRDQRNRSPHFCRGWRVTPRRVASRLLGTGAEGDAHRSDGWRCGTSDGEASGGACELWVTAKRGPSTASRAAQTPREEKSAGLRSG